MAMFLLSIVTGTLTLVNYYAVGNGYISSDAALKLQTMLSIITIFAVIFYKGKRFRKSFDGGQYSIFTFKFGVVFISLLGNISIEILLILYKSGYINSII